MIDILLVLEYCCNSIVATVLLQRAGARSAGARAAGARAAAAPRRRRPLGGGGPSAAAAAPRRRRPLGLGSLNSYAN